MRIFFLEDLLIRYYDYRKVAVDLIANFIKEGRPKLVPEWVNGINDFFSTETPDPDCELVTTKEVQRYYREAALIWGLYLRFRKENLTLHRVIGSDYHYMLSKKIQL